MNPLIKLKTIAPPLLITLTLLCFGLLPRAQAVVPPPDGGYPNFTTAEGTKALQSLTTGSANTAVGWYSLFSDTTGSFNTGAGAGALALNTAENNTATGAAALLLNTTGHDNTANGVGSLALNNTGNDNTAIGTFALYSNTGDEEGSGSFNTAVGDRALFSNTVGTDNTANGYQALYFNTTGFFNTANGVLALYFNTTGYENTANGVQALEANTTGNFNTANGYLALLHNTTGVGNTANGQIALSGNTTGSFNTALGAEAGVNLTTGDNNIDIGNGGVADDSSTIRIGSESQTRTFIAAIRGVTTGIADAVNVVIDSNGQLGTMSSSRRFKKDIEPMEAASEAILALRPVTFHYKSDQTSTPQFGLVAEDVAQVNPALVVHDKDGKIYTVRYDAVNAMLLNEFLKEHRKVENLKNDFQAIVAQHQKEIAALAVTVKEQAAQIQKVSVRLAAASPSGGGLEASKGAPQVVNNP
jgi:Chaperone of endosialidase